MNKTTWKEKTEFVGIAAIAASLLFVGLQMKQAGAIANAELQNEMIAARTARDEFVAQHAELLHKANSGGELTGADVIILESLVSTLWGEAFFGQRRWEFVGHPAVDAPVRAFAIALHDNPGLRHAWTRFQLTHSRGRLLSDDPRVASLSTLSDRFDDQIEQYLERFDQDWDQ